MIERITLGRGFITARLVDYRDVISFDTINDYLNLCRGKISGRRQLTVEGVNLGLFSIRVF